MIRHLYVHIPFCPKVCPYCSFYKTEAAAGGFREFVEAVLTEAKLVQEIVQPQTVFFGGGTPTALNASQLDRLISGLADQFDFSGVEEFTVEMNPATVSPGKATALRKLGVNRASLGVQSWEPAILQTLGRSHSAEMAERSIHILREAGFADLNLDHMFGVPGQSPEDWHRTIDRSLAYQPTHISAYSLTYEEDTEFFEKLGRGEFVADNGLDADLFDETITRLESAGFEHYETSNYAQPDHACRHNLAYWSGKDFLGLGPSAVSTIGATRTKNVSDTKEYVRRCEAGVSAADTAEELTTAELRLERIALGLRTSRGIEEKDIASETADPLIDRGLLHRVGDRLVLARSARSLADEIALEMA